MNKTQVSALRRIIQREIKSYRPRSRQPAPGQHHSEDKFVITDGRIFVLLHRPSISLPFGKRADSFIQIVRNERECGTHMPIPVDQIDLLAWRVQIQQDSDSSFVELSTMDSNGQAVTGYFDPQLLVDASEAVGDEVQFFLGMGQYSSRSPSLLVFPQCWKDGENTDPIAVLLPLQRYK